MLAILGFVVLLAVLSRGGGDEPAAPAPRAASRAEGRRPAAGQPVDEIVELEPVEPENVPSKYEPGRDPFRFYQAPPPPPPPPQPKPAPAPQPVAPALPPQPAAPPKPQPPPLTLKYLGSFGPADRPIDRNSAMDNGRSGMVTQSWPWWFGGVRRGSR